jgi:hypothetical protein
MKENVESLEAKQGERMIEIKVRYWTNDLSGTKGKIPDQTRLDIRCDPY